MNTIAAIQFRTLSAVLGKLVNGIQNAFAYQQQVEVARQPANRLCNRMLNDIGQYQYSELREVRTVVAARGDRFPF